jgi:hypothetical protein
VAVSIQGWIGRFHKTALCRRHVSPSLVIFSHACKEFSTFGCWLITLVGMAFLLRVIGDGVMSFFFSDQAVPDRSVSQRSGPSFSAHRPPPRRFPGHTLNSDTHTGEFHGNDQAFPHDNLTQQGPKDYSFTKHVIHDQDA